MHRHYSGKGEVLVKGYKVPLVGSVCMDFTMIDVTEVPGIKIGDSVLIFGEDEQGCINPAEQFAEKGSTIVYELMTCLGPRIPRIFIYEENQ
jgi:alanine racemase/UDP-N-acetylmuramoyl-tripeptide--D-alanyl-D-alanine ligase